MDRGSPAVVNQCVYICRVGTCHPCWLCVDCWVWAAGGDATCVEAAAAARAEDRMLGSVTEAEDVVQEGFLPQPVRTQADRGDRSGTVTCIDTH